MRSMVLAFFILFGLSAMAAPSHDGLSAIRLPGESYDQAHNRAVINSDLLRISDTQDDTPSDVQMTLDKIDFRQVPELPSMDELWKEFRFIRDTRFIQDPTINFPRRLTWLYPDDGCYARAEMATQFTLQRGLPAPKKFFVFGNLTAQTPNAPGGEVGWWYHVAPIYRVKSAVYILDPAINPKQPLLVKDWIHAITASESQPHFALCSSATYDPDSSCSATAPNPQAKSLSDQEYFMRPEWDRLVELGRDPRKELGTNPPWIRY